MGESGGVFFSVRRHSSRYRMVWMTVTSGTGVILLKPKRSLSRHSGRYLSKRIIRLAFSDCTLRLSIQLLTTLGKMGALPGEDRPRRWLRQCLSPWRAPLGTPM